MGVGRGERRRWRTVEVVMVLVGVRVVERFHSVLVFHRTQLQQFQRSLVGRWLVLWGGR